MGAPRYATDTLDLLAKLTGLTDRGMLDSFVSRFSTRNLGQQRAAKLDLLRKMQALGILTDDQLRNRSRSLDPFGHLIRENRPQVAETAASYVPPEAKYLGAGTESMVFDLDDDRVLKLFGNVPGHRPPPPEAPDPPILQPEFYRSLNERAGVGIYPKVDRGNLPDATTSDLMARESGIRQHETVLDLEEALRALGIEFFDDHVGNVGFRGDKPVLIDHHGTYWPRGWSRRQHVNFPLLMALMGGAYGLSGNQRDPAYSAAL